MIWYIAVNNQPEKITEAELIGKIEKNEIEPDTLVVNAEIKEWIPLQKTEIWKDNFAADKGVLDSEVSDSQQAASEALICNPSNESVHLCVESSDETVITDNPVINAARKLFASPAVLIAAISFTVYVILSMVNNMFFLPSSLVRTLWGSWHIDVFSIVTDIFISIPSILIVIGLWITYASAVKQKNKIMKTSGLTIIKIGLIIQTVFICIVSFITGIVVAFESAKNNIFVKNTEALNATVGNKPVNSVDYGIIFNIIGIVIGVILIILFYVNLIEAISGIKTAAKTGKVVDKGYTFVITCFFIAGIAAFGVILLIELIQYNIIGLETFLNMDIYYYIHPYLFRPITITMFFEMFLIAACITFGVFFIIYKRKINAVVEQVRRSGESISKYRLYSDERFRNLAIVGVVSGCAGLAVLPILFSTVGFMFGLIALSSNRSEDREGFKPIWTYKNKARGCGVAATFLGVIGIIWLIIKIITTGGVL